MAPVTPSLTASPATREVSHSSSSITMATIRQNYSEECEALVNKYVNTKLYHSYVYLYMVREEGERTGRSSRRIIFLF